MAGIGFELRKLFREETGLLSSAKSYAYSSVTTVGPMLLCMLMIFANQMFMRGYDVAYLERELFLTTVVYVFIFSVLVTGGLSMVLTRFIADRIFEGKNEHLLSSYYGAIAICLPLGAVVAWLFLSRVEAGIGYKAVVYVLFAELIIIWIQSVHLSALKDYSRIVRHFAYGVSTSLIGTWLVLRYSNFDTATAVLTVMAVGFFIVIWCSARHFESFFPSGQSRLYFAFLSYIMKYPSLLLIGTFFYIGVYTHTFVYWFSSYGFSVAEAYRVSPFYDLPVFYAYLTVVPTLVTFVVSVETSFYDKFRDYYSKILNGGTLQEVAQAKRDMQRTLMQEISFVMEVQLLFTIISLAIGIKLLPAIGFTMAQLDTFKILALGYFLFIIAFITLLIMLYFDDRKGVTFISALLVLLNTGLTWWSMSKGFHGLGLFIASFVVLCIAFVRLIYYLRNIDYYTFCSQPIMPSARKKWWRIGKSKSAAAFMLICMLLTACSGADSNGKNVGSESVSPAVTNSDKLIEDKRIYERDDDLSVKTLYVTVLPDDNQQESPMTWYAMNRIRERAEESDLKVIVQEGGANGSGPESGMFGYGESKWNGEISLRGNTARFYSQRSYKINLNDQAGLWNDQRVLNLNKHPTDPTRIRNKLSFDLFETLPDSVSLRTQFVHLYLKDLSETGSKEHGYTDYGLFTHIEQPNKQFLRNHWLDPNGQLYKAILFEFFPYKDEIKLESDPAYDQTLFNSRLEIRGREEHEKLVQLLEDVNDLNIPINEVIEKHFNLDNYLTWLAANILMDNMDTNAANYLIYSPLNSDKWYFFPWDYDGGWELQRTSGSIGETNKGISNYWGVVLHSRFLRSEANIKLLKDKIDVLYDKHINGSLQMKIAQYREVVEPFLNRAPDRNFLPESLGTLDEQFRMIADTPLRSIQRFQEDLERPRPFFLGDLVQVGEVSQFNWDPAFDLQGDDLTYDWAMSKDPAFTQILKEEKGLMKTSHEVRGMDSGTYYWRVIVKDASGNRQIPFDLVKDEKGEPHYGIRQIEVK